MSGDSDSSLRRRPAWSIVAFDVFLGHAPDWYKITLIAALGLNPIALLLFGPFVSGWLLLIEFIGALALALRCYPLQPAGLLAIEALFMGLTSTAHVAHEVKANFSVILLLMFMVAGIYFLRSLLLYIFTGLLVRVRSKRALSLTFCAVAALLSAFLDALTVIAVIVSVAAGFYMIYHRVASGGGFDDDQGHDHEDDGLIEEQRREDLVQFRGFLRSLVMHAAVGTALGGVCTLVGEPQNLLIGDAAGWSFLAFAVRMAPVTLPVLIVGLCTCLALESLHWFGYGDLLPESVREVMERYATREREGRDRAGWLRLGAQALAAAFLVVGLLLHLAEVGLIGLAVIVLATALCGVVDERRIGHAFEEALPFTALLVTFFAIVAVIQEQHLFVPIIEHVLATEGRAQLVMMYVANGVLSAISDNVFVASVYIKALETAAAGGHLAREQFELLAVAVNTGTNIPSVATPNGQAAFLFLLTSALAPLIRLGYGRMLWMALPYTVMMSLTGLIAVWVLL
ncbi:MAG: sodium/proton antiporter NhaB [Rhodanobacteraceae bacterium]